MSEGKERGLGDVLFPTAEGDVQRALGGNTESAAAILRDFVGSINERNERIWPNIGPPIEWAYARYLADAFQKILDGTDANRALGIKIPRGGRRPGTGRLDEEALAAAFNLLLLRGVPKAEARRALAEAVKCDKSMIGKADKKHASFAYFRESLTAASSEASEAKAMFSQVIESAAEPYRAHVEGILRTPTRTARLRGGRK